jgi:hypothetical protein
MDHINSVRAALKAAAPVVAIPVEGHAPICIKAKLLKGALKGVTIDSVKVLANRWLEVKGRDTREKDCIPVRTCAKFSPMDRYAALQMIREWSDKERKRRKVVALQGVLSAKEQRAMKLAKAEKVGVAELIQAQKEEAEILAEARANVNPVLTPVDEERRQDILAEYKAFREQRGNRKRGAVIRWKLDKLRKDKAALVTVKREYEERPSISPFARRRKVMVGTKTVLRRKKDAVKYAALIYQIGRLEKQYKSLYPPIWIANEYIGNGGYSNDSWITKRPKVKAYEVSWDHRHMGDEDEETALSKIRRMAEHLKNVRADIRALNPPEDEQEELSQAA